MKKFLAVMGIIFALAVLPAASYSQSAAGQSSEQTTNNSDKASKVTANSTEFPASKAIGKAVQNGRGEYLGVIRDLMVDPQNGGAAFVLLSPGGVLGIPSKLVPVPFGAVTFNSAKNVYFLDMSRDQIIAAPGFDWGGLPQYANRDWEGEIFRYYGLTPAWGESGQGVAAGQGAAYRLNEFRGKPVRDPQGEKLGCLRDLVIDSQGHVPYAVVSHGGFLGIGEKLVTVSLRDLKFDQADRSFVLPWTKEQLDGAPAFKQTRLGTRS